MADTRQKKLSPIEERRVALARRKSDDRNRAQQKTSPPESVPESVVDVASFSRTAGVRVAVVLGTYNRLTFVHDAVMSIRRASGGVRCTIVVVDGGSSDGSRKWLSEQPDVWLIEQSGPLTGAVAAFNLGFGYAVDHGFDYVMNLNDDCKVTTFDSIRSAVDIMEMDAGIGGVAFAFDLRGGWNCEEVHGVTYLNFGVVRTKAGKEVAVAQGGQTGRAWWNPIYRTYGADCEFGMWLHRLGWKVVRAMSLRVHDRTKETWGDTLRQFNQSDSPGRQDSALFWKRWPNSASLKDGPAA